MQFERSAAFQVQYDQIRDQISKLAKEYGDWNVGSKGINPFAYEKNKCDELSVALGEAKLTMDLALIHKIDSKTAFFMNIGWALLAYLLTIFCCLGLGHSVAWVYQGFKKKT